MPNKKGLDVLQADIPLQGDDVPVEELDTVIIRFAGDSGDGMQLMGTQFTNVSAIFGNDISTLPDYPAEIRAPAGSLPGVSGFQVAFSNHDILTPGDQPDVLVVMNPAALKVNLSDLKDGGILIANTDEFTKANLAKAEYDENPLESKGMSGYRVVKIPITTLTLNALEESILPPKIKQRCKNTFALGVLYWLFDRPMESTIDFYREYFGKKNPDVAEANVKVLKTGYNYSYTTELFHRHYRVRSAHLPPGKYRKMTGNEAIATGLIAAAMRAGRPLFYGSYPITPASDILHYLSGKKKFGVKTFQAEDEIAAMGSAIGAAFGGDIAVTGTSGPGLALKSEAINLAVMTELPVIIANIQRGGPSTGLPTKTEQSDLLQAMFGRNGDSPVAVVAPSSPADCFWMAFEAVKIAAHYMTPVYFMSDGFIANGSEPFRVPSVEELPEITVEFATDPETFQPYARDPETLSRPWVVPGTPGLEHRIGGLEKADGSGAVNYGQENHERMTNLRMEKIERIANDIPEQEIFGDEEGELLVVSWGGTYGAVTSAVERSRDAGKSVSGVHLRYLNPFPRNLGDILKRFRKVMVAELNTGQMAMLLRAKYLVDAKTFTRVMGRPFRVTEIADAIGAMLDE
jgi:2-oxoglutarate/2-oxoacid ferredoxin oxidoreductase subunit alpha